MTITIELHHHERGPMRVRICEDATWWERRRIWTDIDSDGLTYEDGDFEESETAINLKLLVARNSQIAAARAENSASNLRKSRGDYRVSI